MDQKASYRKMNDAFIWLNNLVLDILESPSCLLIFKDLSPSILPTKRHVDIADVTLDVSILSIGTIRFYIRKTKRDPYYTDFGYVILDEIDQFIEEY